MWKNITDVEKYFTLKDYSEIKKIRDYSEIKKIRDYSEIISQEAGKAQVPTHIRHI